MFGYNLLAVLAVVEVLIGLLLNWGFWYWGTSRRACAKDALNVLSVALWKFGKPEQGDALKVLEDFIA